MVIGILATDSSESTPQFDCMMYGLLRKPLSFSPSASRVR